MVPCASPRRISILESEEPAAREGKREMQTAADPASVDCKNSRRVFKGVSCVTGNCCTKSIAEKWKSEIEERQTPPVQGGRTFQGDGAETFPSRPPTGCGPNIPIAKP